MKRNITKFLAALALLVFIAPSMVAWGQTSYTLTIDVSDFNSTSYAANNGSHSKNAVDVNNASNTLAIEWFSNQVMLQSNVMQWQKNNGYIYNTTDLGTITSVTVNSTEGTFTTYYGSTQAPSTNTTVGGGFFQTKVGNATGKTTSIVINFTISGGTIPTCAAPTFSPVAGTYTEAQTISISCTTDGATIYYTTDGEDPTSESGVYTSSFTISETTTVKAMAVKEGMNNSGIVTAVYTIEAPAPVQSFSQIDGHNPVAGQTYLIVDLNTNKALTSANGTGSAPSAVAVAIENNQISTNNTDIQWTFEAVEGGYTIHPVGDNAKWLYTTTSSGNSVRVGTGSNKVWTLDITSITQQYHGFKNNGSSFYLGVYNSQDWRGYSSINTNIENTQIALFVLGEAPAPTPYITANGVNIAYNATNGEITYTINNPDADATLTADITNSTIDNFALGTVGASSTTFTCGANTVTEPRTATVTLNYVKNGETLATKDVTITQAAAPVIYNSIEALFNAATSTETDVIVGFDGWVVTGVKGSQAFVSDGTNGLIIYQSGHGFEAGNTLTGTISCRLVLYYGAAELKGITSTTEGLTVGEGGTVTPQVLTASQMTNGIKTGAVVTFENLAYDGTGFSDGTNTITVKTDLYDYSNDVESGNSYNITGVYEHSMRIYPRSAEDIVEYTPVTVPALYNYSINGVEGEAIDANVGDVITLNAGANINDEYTFAGWTTNASNVNERLTGSYTLTEEVTTFYAVYAHTTGASSGTGEANYVKVTSTDDLTDGNYLIVYEDALVAFDGSLETLDAAGNTIEVEIEEGVIAANETVNASAFTITAIEGGYSVKSASGYYIGTTTYNNELKTSNTTEYINAISFDNNDDVLIQMSYDNGDVTLKFNSASNQARFRYYKSGQQNIQLYKYTGGGTPGTTSYYTYVGFKDVAAYEGDGGYYLIASPAEVDPATVEGMTDGTFDLYYYDDAQGDEWINYRASETTINHFNIVPGTGYLYANSADVTLTFAGTHYVGNGQVSVIAGWNLIGNPFAVAATPNTPYYRLNGEGGELNAETEEGAVKAMEGVFVNVTAAGNVTFSTTAPGKGQNIALNLSKATRGASTGSATATIDRAIVRFDEGQQLPKFQLFENSTKLYIAQGNQDFAIVRSAAQGEMPVSFKASENGTYTLAVETENMEMDYLHLIDNMTGMDVDLLQIPSYTFEAKTNDYASRFRLVFKGNSTEEQTTETFAYFNGTSWTVSNLGEATLQVVDVMGRLVSTETINGNATINLNETAGIYMLRLVNGNDVKVQKVVVR